MKAKWIQLGLAAVIIAAGLGAAAIMVLLGQSAEKSAGEEIVSLGSIDLKRDQLLFALN